MDAGEVVLHGEQPDRLARGEVGDAAGRQAAGPEERVDRALAQRDHGGVEPDVAGLEVLVRVDAERAEHPLRHEQHAGAAAPERHPGAAQLGDRGQRRGRGHHDVHHVVVDARERAWGSRVAGRGAGDAVGGGVDLVEGDVGLAVGEQLQVVDRTVGGRDDGRCAQAQRVAPRRRERLAQRVVDAVAAAGGHGEPHVGVGRRAGRETRGQAEAAQRPQCGAPGDQHARIVHCPGGAVEQVAPTLVGWPAVTPSAPTGAR